MDNVVLYISDFLNEFINILGEMSPYLLLGFFFAGLLHVFISKEQINKYFGGNKFTSSVNAALFGVPLPLCSCGVIPTGMSFYKSGASKGSTVSFLISTPQTGIDSILATYALMGLPFALIRPVIAFITGVFGGYFTNVIDYTPPVIVDEDKEEKQHLTLKEKVISVFRYGFVEFLQDISKWLVIGLVLAAIISVLIPDNFFANAGLHPFVQMLIVLVASIPLYVCATASVPLAAILILKGISPGAALVLLMAGPATNAATITMIAKVLGKKSLFTYLFSIIGGALFFGFIVDAFLPAEWFNQVASSAIGHHHHSNGIELWSGIILLLLIVNGYYLKYRNKQKVKNSVIEQDNNMGTQKVKVEGMTCNHCVANVENNLKKLDFITDAKANLETGVVELSGENIELDKVQSTVDGLGYKYSS